MASALLGDGVLRSFCPILFILKILFILSKTKKAAAWPARQGVICD